MYINHLFISVPQKTIYYLVGIVQLYLALELTTNKPLSYNIRTSIPFLWGPFSAGSVIASIIEDLSEDYAIKNGSDDKRGDDKPVPISLLNAGEDTSQTAAELHCDRYHGELAGFALSIVCPDLNPLQPLELIL